jgi:SAM-dependent methyltransferase
MDATDDAAGEDWYARLYDARGIGWPGELERYRQLAAGEGCVGPDGRGVLEIACGTGRVALDLAAHGCRVTGLDRSPAMIEAARAKTTGDNPAWHVADMRTFRLAGWFGLALIPGHSFQLLLTADDQVAALERIRDHLVPGGLLAVHLDQPDPGWLRSLPRVPGEPGRGRLLLDPASGRRFRLACSWARGPAARAATAFRALEELEPAGDVVGRWELEPMVLRVVSRAEMERALQRAGFAIEAVNGDFAGGPCLASSPDMLWLARRP